MVLVRVSSNSNRLASEQDLLGLHSALDSSYTALGMANTIGKRKWKEEISQIPAPVETALALSLSSQQEQQQQQQKQPQAKRRQQLTIFYGGAVNVFDNVPEDMVRALMILAASKSSNAPPTSFGAQDGCTTTTTSSDPQKALAMAFNAGGLPQARRASIQRFLQKRKHKQFDVDKC